MLAWPASDQIKAQLEQNLVFQNNRFVLTKDGIFVMNTKRGKVTQFFAPYEDIGSNMIVEKRNWLMDYFPIGLVFYVIYKIITNETIEVEWQVIYILAVFSVLFFVYLWLEASSHQSIVGGNFVIRFFYDAPSKKEVDQFITDLFKYRKINLIERYATIDRNRDPKVQLEQFTWMKNNGILSESEFEKLRDELINGNKTGPIGFVMNN